MPMLEVAHAQIWFQDEGGTGAPIIFIHPGAATSECWVHQIPTFSDAGFRCITYDLRGRGRSAVMSLDGDPGCASDGLDALARHLKLDRFMIVAAAYGGFAGTDFALRFPERLSAFVLATSHAGLVDPEYQRQRDRIAGPELRALPIHYRKRGPSYQAENPDGVERRLKIQRSAGRPPRQQSLHFEITFPMLETLRVPTLVLAGDADLLTPPSIMRQVAAHIPSSEFATVPEAGHPAHWERPDEWNLAALNFLERHRVSLSSRQLVAN